jgi:hypothetical protein
MSFETSKRRSVHPDQPVSAENELASDPDTENTLDLDAVGRLRSLFELLDKWDQEEKTNGK